MSFGRLMLGGLLMGAMATGAQADILAFEVGATSWGQDYEGRVQDGPDSIGLNETLGFGDETGTGLYAVLEHPVPLLPNVKLARMEMDINASTTLSEQVSFDGEVYTVNADVDSNLDLSHTDATFYYEVLDNVVSLDLGLTVRKFDGGVELSSDTLGQSSREDLDDPVPLVYVAVRADLPFTGLYVGAEGHGLSVGDASLIDLEAVLGWESPLGLGVKAGVRRFDLDYEDDADEKVDITIDGVFVGAFFRF